MAASTEERVALDRYTIIEPERTWSVWNWLQAYDPGAHEFAVVARRGGSR